MKEIWEKTKNWFKERKNKYDINETLKRIAEKSRTVEPGSEEFRRLRMDYEQELKSKRLTQELALAGVPWTQIIFIGGMLIISGLAFLLDMDSPKALKNGDRLISLIKTGLNRHF